MYHTALVEAIFIIHLKIEHHRDEVTFVRFVQIANTKQLKYHAVFLIQINKFCSTEGCYERHSFGHQGGYQTGKMIP